MAKSLTTLLLLVHLIIDVYPQIASENIKAWYAADTSVITYESKVIQWNDISGNSHHLIQSVSLNQPNLVNDALNGKPVVRFNSDHFMEVIFSQTYNQPVTFFIIWKTFVAQSPAFSINNSNADGLRAESANRIFGRAGNNLLLNRNTPFDYLLHAWEINGSTSRIYENSILRVTGNSGANTINKLLLGRLTGFPVYQLQGDIAEIVFVTGILNSQERNSFENILMDKYSPRLLLGDTIKVNYGFCPIIINAGPSFQSYIWSTGEETNQIEVSKEGYYSVRVTDNFGRVHTDSVYVSYPSTSLNHVSATICFGENREIFSLIPNSALYTYEWSNGSENHSIEVSESGRFWVKIIDDQGCFSFSDTLYTEIDEFSKLISLGGDKELCSGKEIELLQSDPNSEIIEYLWSTGDSTTSIIVNESNFYSLTVTNQNGCIGSDQVYINIVGSAPNVIFEASTVCLGDTTNFSDLSQTTNGDDIVAWFWNFGDGVFSEDQNPSFIYPESGIHPISLFVTAASGCSQLIEGEIEVLEIPTSFFETSLSCVNIPYQFIDLSHSQEDNEIILWNWQFNNEFQSDLQNPIFSFNSSGSFEIGLTVQTENGCSNSYYSFLSVLESFENPEGFTFVLPKNNQVLANTEVFFQWNPSDNATKYQVEIATDNMFENIIMISEFTSYTELMLELQPNTYYSRVKAFNICRDYIYSVNLTFSIPSFTSNEYLKLWLSADSVSLDENGKVSQIFDKSTNNNHAFQSNLTFKPTWVAQDDDLNNNPAIVFNGINQFLNGTTIKDISDSSLSFFILSVGDSVGAAGEYKTLFSIDNNFWLGRYVQSNRQNITVYNNNAVNGVFNNYPNNGKKSIHSFLKDLNNRGYLYQNGRLEISDQSISGSINENNYKVGLSSSFTTTKHWRGKVVEIMLFNKYFSDKERKEVESYFQSKYSPPINLGPDRNSTNSFCLVTLDAGERFVSYLWSTGETTQTIEVNEPGVYGVTVTDIFGFQSTDELRVRYPETGLNISEITLCEGESVSLELSTTLKGDMELLWNTGSTTPAIEVDQAGVYTLMITDSEGCKRELSAQVAVDFFASTATLGNARPFCMGDTLYVQSDWLPDQLSNLWNDGSTGSGLPITGPGSFSVVSTNPNGCVATAATSLSLQGYAPQVHFTTTAECLGEPTLFTDASVVEDSEITSRLWSFGDPLFGEGSGQQVTYTYSQAGMFEATLQVQSAAGCSRSYSELVQVYHLPNGFFTPNNTCSNVPVKFNDATTDQEGGIVAWQWEFRDVDGTLMGTSQLAGPEFTFTQPGTAQARLMVTSAVGCTDTILRSINVKESPEIGFSFTTPCLGEPVFFADQSTAPPWAGIIGHRWDFGDSNTSSQLNPSHLYQQDGIFNATLTVEAINGCKPSLTRQVTVHSMPVVDFEIPVLCAGAPGLFTDMSTVLNSSISQWSWAFPEAGTSSQQHALWSFAQPSQYMVELTATSEAGCSNHLQKIADVYEIPRPEFGFFPRFGVAPLMVSFTNQSQGASQYLWDFGDGSTPSTQLQPVHTYTQNGIYVASLVVTNNLGCSDTLAREIKVIPLSIDIAVTDVAYQVRNNYMEARANLMNLGTLEFDSLYLELHVGGQRPLRELWTGLLRPGDIISYTFRAQLPFTQGYDYFCVEAFIPGLDVDDNMANNRRCLSFRDEFSLLPPYPNPAESYVNIGFIVPMEGQAEITISDARGQVMGETFRYQAAEGINFIRLPLAHLRKGVYFFRVSFREEVKVGRFVVH